MEVVRSNKGAWMVAVAFFAFCAATVLFQQIALSKVEDPMPIDPNAKFALTGETASAVLSSP